jgi:putative DNA primase/helicase
MSTTNDAAGRKAAIEKGEAKPSALPVNFAGIPDALKEFAQWVCWRYERVQDKSGQWKWTKVPINARTGGGASHTNRKTWSRFDQAKAHYEKGQGQVDGIGFVFSADDPFTGVDLDDCRDPITGIIESWAVELIDLLAGYAEVSPSGTGVKVWVRGNKPGTRCNTAYATGKVEMYDRLRYFAMTGCTLSEATR